MPDLSSFPSDAAGRTFARLLPRIQTAFKQYRNNSPTEWEIFSHRLTENFEALFNSLVQVYGDQYDFYFHLESLLIALVESWISRSPELKELDQIRQCDPHWFQSNRQVGGVCYVDLFAGNLTGLQSNIAYFNELGLTYLHRMPLFQSPAGEK